MTEIKKFRCADCEFSASSKYCLERHYTSIKHIKNAQLSDEDKKKFQCLKCNKYYKENSGLWRHIKICKFFNAISEIGEHKEEQTQVNDGEPARKLAKNESTMNQEVLEEIRKMNELSRNQEMEMKKMNKMIADLKQNQKLTTTINNNNTPINNTFNMNIFLNESCYNAINFEDFIKKILFEHADSKLMIDSYVEGTCNIIQRNLEELPINKRPLHYLAGEDPHQQLLHIREGDEWNVVTELNWMQQIHADDDDLVEKKNPIYYALKEIDDEKLKYLGYYFNQDKEYKTQHARLHREISRPDFKEKVYEKLMKMITLDTDKLDGIFIKSKIVMG